MAVTYNKMEIDVNVKPEDIITAVQDDSDSRYLDVFLFDSGVPIDLTGHEVRIYMRKPKNGGEIFNNGEITEPENGRCQFLMTTAALENMGWLQVQISIWKDNKEILSTQVFRIFVTESLRTTGSIEGSNEYGALVVLFQNLYQSIDLMTDMVQNFGSAGEVAAGIPVETFWQMLEALYTVNKDALENASVSEVLNRIGLTGDTGGSQTEGTVFGKENAIMEMMKKYNSEVKNNMVLKQTETKTISLTAGQLQILSFSFDKPVKFLAMHFSGYTLSVGFNVPTYIINGEDSFRINTAFAATNAWYPIRWGGTTRNEIKMMGTIANATELFPDIWITQLDFHFTAPESAGGQTVNARVLYQEEG